MRFCELPAEDQGNRSSTRAWMERTFRPINHELPANGAGVALERVHGRIRLAAVLLVAEGGLIQAGAFRHDRQGQPGCLPWLFQLMNQDPHLEKRPALDRTVMVAAGLWVLLGRAVLELLAYGIVPATLRRMRKFAPLSDPAVFFDSARIREQRLSLFRQMKQLLRRSRLPTPIGAGRTCADPRESYDRKLWMKA